jgi:glutamyl-tRNA reductase
MTSEPESIVALVAHARHVPAAERRRFADRLREETEPGGGLLLETCHRVELYAWSDLGLSRLIVMLPPGGEILVGEAAARHAIAVAVGLDSVVVAEDQVLHQLRTSIAAAHSHGGLDPNLERLFAMALRAGRRARSWRQGAPRSLADLALAAIERRRGPMDGRRFLVVGAGEMGQLAVQAATAAGASVLVASRTVEHATTLARRADAATVPFDPGPTVGDIAGAIVALRGPWAIGSSTIEQLASGRAIVVDLSVPAAAPRELTKRLNGRFVSADALARIEADGHAVGPRDARLVELVEDTLAEFSEWVAGRHRRAVAAALVERAEAQRQAELDELWRRLPELEPHVREAIERATRHLAGRLLREPLERLGRDGDGRAEEAARELFAL